MRMENYSDSTRITNPRVGGYSAGLQILRSGDCQIGVHGEKIYRFNIEHAIFRSTQTTTLLPGPNFIPAGYAGIQLHTNRMQYYMRYNEFTNINNCINVGIAAGQYTIGAGTSTINGIYAANIAVVQNTFSPGTGTNNYLNTAVSISGVNSVPWSIAPASVTPYPLGVVIGTNVINNVYRGIGVSGIAGFRTRIEENNITLVKDAVLPTWHGPQHGIHVSNHISAGNFYYQAVVTGNTLTGVSTATPNSKESLVFLSNNISLYSPSVTCNILNGGNNGFVVNSMNKPSNLIGMTWAGNIMYPMVKGLVLSNGGIMGTQGGPTTANANEWRNTWTNYHTDVDGISNASLSVLYIKGGAPYEPTLNFGFIGLDYNTTGNLTISTGGDYNCTGMPNNIVTPYPGEFPTTGMEYIAKTGMYRFLHFNDSIRTSEAALQDFYENLSGSSIDKFMQVEDYINSGLKGEARFINDFIEPEPDNDAEVTYKNFYNIYLNYLESKENEEILSEEDSLALFELCSLCPGRYGACVYQARALYNSIYKILIAPEDCPEDGGSERKSNSKNEAIILNKEYESMNYKLYPNPAADEITIEIANNDTEIMIEIYDLSGRCLQKGELKIKNRKASFKVDLINGAYIITVISRTNEKENRKLLISR
jgi:hypothetical protein